MWAAILSFIGGPIVNGLISAYKAKLDAANTTDAQAADLAAKEIAAEQGRWYTAIIRPLFALPLIIYFWKTIIYDKVLGWGVTDPLTGMIGEWAGWIIVAYFGGRSIEKVARVFGRK